ncbi:Protein CBG14554 [Caenorhabditis briggsae]|uniref:Protein CBG14554 n=1 Tax=Caenorhabditis briggsae TaxID=6238 RepID=A8XK65_CAEBR|nr:Protein CBG14554 [Caenorhabditis briggsae]CAP33040.1 Protein CBG14554 [Caenorhabditis briggsae]
MSDMEDDLQTAAKVVRKPKKVRAEVLENAYQLCSYTGKMLKKIKKDTGLSGEQIRRRIYSKRERDHVAGKQVPERDGSKPSIQWTDELKRCFAKHPNISRDDAKYLIEKLKLKDISPEQKRDWKALQRKYIPLEDFFEVHADNNEIREFDDLVEVIDLDSELVLEWLGIRVALESERHQKHINSTMGIRDPETEPRLSTCGRNYSERRPRSKLTASCLQDLEKFWEAGTYSIDKEAVYKELSEKHKMRRIPVQQWFSQRKRTDKIAINKARNHGQAKTKEGTPDDESDDERSPPDNEQSTTIRKLARIKVEDKSKICSFCGNGHIPDRTADARWERLRQHSLCQKCLLPSFQKQRHQCPSGVLIDFGCYYCKEEVHNSALCRIPKTVVDTKYFTPGGPKDSRERQPTPDLNTEYDQYYRWDRRRQQEPFDQRRHRERDQGPNRQCKKLVFKLLCCSSKRNRTFCHSDANQKVDYADRFGIPRERNETGNATIDDVLLAASVDSNNMNIEAVKGFENKDKENEVKLMFIKQTMYHSNQYIFAYNTLF